MHRTLEKLYLDHAHFHGLIDILEGEIDHNAGGAFFDTTLLLELVDYFRFYADTVHHPIEDQLYELMLAHSDSGRKTMEQLLGQHLVITTLSRELSSALEGTREGSPEAAARVATTGREFIRQQRDHMRYEEYSAFPLLETELDEEAFNIAAGAIPAEEDPLLDSQMQRRYPTLFKLLSTLS